MFLIVQLLVDTSEMSSTSILTAKSPLSSTAVIKCKRSNNSNSNQEQEVKITWDNKIKHYWGILRIYNFARLLISCF